MRAHGAGDERKTARSTTILGNESDTQRTAVEGVSQDNMTITRETGNSNVKRQSSCTMVQQSKKLRKTESKTRMCVDLCMSDSEDEVE